MILLVRRRRREALMEKPIQGSSMVPYLPLEVMTQILEKLPVKTLLKFRVVCKLWCSLISSEHFVRRHLSLCASNTQRIIMNPSGSLYDLRYYSVNGSIVLDETSIDIRIGGHNYLCVMGSCDGLICLKEYFTGTILLWNPSTRDFKVLPSTSEVGVPDVVGFNDPWRYGFGYDYNSDDYKVLILLPCPSISPDLLEKSYKSIIYTLRSNSWRRIQDSLLGIHIGRRHAHSAFASGALHWNVRTIGGIGAIVSFDLTSETYKEVALPISGCKRDQLEVGASSGCLCLCLHSVDGGSIDIWVMKEYGVRESWTKTVKIPQDWDTVQHRTFIIKPLTWLIENGEILLYACGSCVHPVSYNANKNSLLHFEWNRKIHTLSNPNPVEYVESLVSPNAYNNLRANEVCRLNVKIVLGKVASMASRRPALRGSQS